MSAQGLRVYTCPPLGRVVTGATGRPRRGTRRPARNRVGLAQEEPEGESPAEEAEETSIQHTPRQGFQGQLRVLVGVHLSAGPGGRRLV